MTLSQSLYRARISRMEWMSAFGAKAKGQIQLEDATMQPVSRRSADRRWFFLLSIPFIGLLTPVYLRSEPSVGGVPFFYWYQLCWIPISAVLTWVVYVKTREEESEG